ncbi:transposase, partial [Paracoccus binzhouensis]|uniref:transposase n=1 Tax=Paracoccus binzhouensis TaxID=2796149 RepID=UPI001E6445D1
RSRPEPLPNYPKTMAYQRSSKNQKLCDTALGNAIESRNALPMIPMRKNRKVRKVVDMTIYTLRNMVERCFNKLKNSRRLATRYDKTADSFLGFIDIACIRLWLRHLST